MTETTIFDNLEIIPMNKTVVFNTPLEDEEELIVRTGTVSDGSCFFHALLHAYSKKYVEMDKKERQNFVRQIRLDIAKHINIKNWQKITDGVISKVPFQEKINKILHNFFTFLSSNNYSFSCPDTNKVIKELNCEEDEYNKSLYNIIFELVPVQNGFEKNILPKSYSLCESKTIDSCIEYIIENTLDYLSNVEEFNHIDSEKKEYIINNTSNMLKVILSISKKSCFKNYIKNIENSKEPIDSYTVSVISDYFKRDIYFLDSKNRIPYNFSAINNVKNRKSIVILWVKEYHYEIIGKMHPNNKIQREFSHDDPFIQKIYTFLNYPEQISKKYPELIPYLPYDSKYDNSDDEEDNNTYYSSSSSSN